MSEQGELTDEQMQRAEQTYQNAQAEAAYMGLVAAGQETDEDVIDLLDAFQLPTRADGFVIDGDGKADWTLRKIGEAEARMRRDVATVRAEVERWTTWQAKRDEQNQATIDRFQSLLSVYYDQLKASGALGKRSKSYHLPHGVLAAKAHEVKWMRREPEVLAWAKAADPKGEQGLVRTKEEVAWDVLKKRLKPEKAEIGAQAVDTATGELVDGVQVQELACDKFQAKPDLD